MITHRPFNPILVLFLGILAVSTSSIFIRFAQIEAPSFVIAAGRLGLATLIIAPFAIKYTLVDLRKITLREKLLILLAGVFLGFHFATWITSLEFTSVASSVVIVTTAPLWVAAFSPLVLNEKITKLIIAGLCVALIGGLIVGFSGFCEFALGTLHSTKLDSLFTGRAFLGDLLALAGAIFSGAYLMTGRKVRSKVNILTYTFLVYGVAAFILLLLVAIRHQTFIGYSTPTYIWIILLALIPQVIGHSSFNWALKYLSAASVSIALLGEPVGTVILAYFFLRESPAIFEIIGGILIMIGISIATRTQKKQEEIPDL